LAGVEGIEPTSSRLELGVFLLDETPDFFNYTKLHLVVQTSE